jgi:hypothetical protein
MCTLANGEQESYEHVASCMSQVWPCEAVDQSDTVRNWSMDSRFLNGVNCEDPRTEGSQELSFTVTPTVDTMTVPVGEDRRPADNGDDIPAWCCVDCLMLFANGITPDEMDESETGAWLDAIERLTEGMYVSLGCRHDDDCTRNHGSEDCDCDDIEFSWSSCDTCGTSLGGSRHAVTLFSI